MRVLVVLRDRPQDEEVAAAAQHLLREDDAVCLLMVLSPSDTRETVSKVGARWAFDHTPVPTTTGLLVPAQSIRPLPAESHLQAAERVRARALATLHRYANGFGARTRVDVEVGVTRSPVDAVLQAAARHRVHGIAIGETHSRGLLEWLRRDPVRQIVRRADVPVLVLDDRIHVPRPAPVATGDASAVLAL